MKQWRVATAGISGNQEIRDWISGNQEIREIVVSSVVPKLNRVIKKWFPKALFVSHKNAGVKIKLKNPAEVGVDRLVNAVAAHALYGGPAIIIDFGTATTFDVINAKGEYLGGAIAPGIVLARDALHERTAKLPKIEIKAPKHVIGKSTTEAMQSGLVYGYAAMVEGMLKKIIKELTPLPPLLSREGEKKGVSCKVIATGGYAKLIGKYTKEIDIIDNELTLKGLKFIY